MFIWGCDDKGGFEKAGKPLRLDMQGFWGVLIRLVCEGKIYFDIPCVAREEGDFYAAYSAKENRRV